MTNKKLVWRLTESPSVEKLESLVKSEILSKEEAREILFKSETEEDRDKESLKSEIKFLRNLIEKFANPEKVVEIIREVERPYLRKYTWWNPYATWTYTDTLSNITTASGTMTNNFTSFSNIKTF